MRMIATGESFDELVIAEPFDIPGTSEQFAVHYAIGSDPDNRGCWAAAHVGTGFAIAFGDTVDEAIAACRAKWASKTPAERAEALDHARQIRRDRDFLAPKGEAK